MSWNIPVIRCAFLRASKPVSLVSDERSINCSLRESTSNSWCGRELILSILVGSSSSVNAHRYRHDHKLTYICAVPCRRWELTCHSQPITKAVMLVAWRGRQARQTLGLRYQPETWISYSDRVRKTRRQPRIVCRLVRPHLPAGCGISPAKKHSWRYFCVVLG